MTDKLGVSRSYFSRDEVQSGKYLSMITFLVSNNYLIKLIPAEYDGYTVEWYRESEFTPKN